MTEPVRDSLLSHPYAQKAAGQVKRHRKVLYGLLGLIVLFGLLGYFWLPGFAKSKAEALLSERLHRPVSVQKVEISPYTLEATIHGFRIGEREGDGTLLKFESLYVNVSSTSLFRAAPVISAVTLKSPEIQIVRDTAGRLSIADLIEELQNLPPSDEPARFSVSNIQVEGGTLVLDDQLKQSRQEISEIALGIPFVASFASAEETWVQPRFSARVNDGSRIVVEGKARPFADRREAALDVKLQGLDMTGVDAYAPTIKGLKLASALVDTDLEIVFGQDGDKPADLRVQGNITLRDFAIDNSAGLPWHVRGERVVLQLQELDLMLKSPITAAIEGSNIAFQQSDKPTLHVNTFSVSDIEADVAAKKISLALAATINEKGSLKASGNAGWAPLVAEFKVDATDVDIVPTQGMLIDRPGMLITRGLASFSGTVAASGSPLNVKAVGDASISDFDLLDKGNQDDLLRWRSLDVHGIVANTFPLDVAIKTVIFADFYARVVITPDGSLRLRDVMSQSGGTLPMVHAAHEVTEHQAEVLADKKVEKRGKGVVTTAAVKEEKLPLPVRIDQLILKNGGANFHDRFIKPNYRANLSQLSGTVGPLHPGKPGTVDIKGRVNRTAPLELSGKIDPFGKQVFVDLTAKAKGIDMPGFSPYSSRYIGYEIAKGKLSVDLHYFLEQGQLRAENHVFLDQFTLGPKVDSPDALSLPVELAVTLLKNSRGEIDIDLPISGSLNDPEFSIGGLIIKVFINLIGKALTAPFTLIGNMFAGGADLSYVEFVPGYARLTPEAEKNLAAISKAMQEKPSLKIEIAGVATSASDQVDLRRATLERKVKAQKLSALAKQGKSGGSLRDVTLSEAEYPKYLELAYQAEKFDKPRNLIGMTKSLPVAEMETLMLSNITVDDEALRGLADRRGREAYAALTEKGVPSERVFVVQPRVETAADGKKPGGRAEFSLR